MDNIEQELRYEFKDKKLLMTALTHSSFANEHRKELENNERLEFLGDSVLSIVVSSHLFSHFSHLPEGELTKIRAALVCEKSLFGFSKLIHLGDYIRLGKGEENTGGRQRASMLADAFEAVIAAIYLDGGFDAATSFVMRFVPTDFEITKHGSFEDYKTTLQEIIQKNPEEKVEYSLVDQVGPDHAKLFVVEVRLNSNLIGTGEGHSKKQAEQNAAREALKLMGYETR